MSYSDILNTTQLYGDLLRKNFENTSNNLANVEYNAGPVNPNSSAAFTPKRSRDIYGYSTEVEDPLTAYSDYNPWSKENLLLQGTQGLTYGKIGKGLSPYLKKGFDVFGKNITLDDGTTKFLKAGEKMPTGATATGGSVDLGPAATVYGLTRDQDPYSYSQTEALGATAANAMAAHQIGAYVAPTAYASGAIGGAGATGLAAVNPYVALAAIAFSFMQNKKRKRKAKRAKEKAIDEYQQELKKGYDLRADQVSEMRDDMLSQQTTRDYEKTAGRYDNQYGGAYAKEGMKYQYEQGGDTDIVAEFTGNELIVNDQDKIEKGLSKGNYAMVAASIKKAMKNKQLTPGPETHQGNPMPVDSKGNIYAGGGTLPFKVKKGAGIYDHATDQFKSTMTDKEIAMTVQENINKWKSNGMA